MLRLLIGIDIAKIISGLRNVSKLLCIILGLANQIDSSVLHIHTTLKMLGQDKVM